MGDFFLHANCKQSITKCGLWWDGSLNIGTAATSLTVIMSNIEYIL